MFTHNFEPVILEIGFISIRWYSLAYIFGILLGWWLARKIISYKSSELNVSHESFDELVTIIIFSIILGGRFGYVLFYNPFYYLNNPLDIFKIWEGGMSFHGGLIGIIIGCYLFSIKKNIDVFKLLDVIACVAPIGLFLGRIANFLNSELYGKPTDFMLSVRFPLIDNLYRHPSQLYEAFFEGVIIFIILNFIMFKKIYKESFCSSLFLMLYGVFRIFSEYFREPDSHLGYLFGFLSMGTLLSFLMIFCGLILYFIKIKNTYEK